MLGRPLAILGLVVSLAATAQAEDRVIILINPNSNDAATQSMADLARAEIGDAATVEGVSNTAAPPLLTTPEDMANAIPGVVAAGVEAAKDPRVAAIIVAAFSDPGLPELRDSVTIPVFGIGEEVFREAARDGRQFGIVTVTPNPELIASFEARAEALGFGAQYKGTRVTPGDPNELVKDPDALDNALSAAVTESIGDGAEAVIMGGGPLSASAIRLQPLFEVPLVVAVNAAARAAIEATKGQ
ncbi:MAG TPA: aspartate/glutamate racemase family protein [Amaricoccus sp.]|nr:aspartate/glutamate racemase family protein [Amaricoccus sp.]